MIDVGGDDRPAARHFLAHELRRDVVGDRRAPILPVARIFLEHRAAEILALGNVLHLRRDDPATGIVHLADVHARLCAQRALHDVGECRHAAGAVRAELAIVLRLHRAACVVLHIAACEDPVSALDRKARRDVDGDVRISIGAGSVVDAHRRFARSRLKMDFPHGDAERPDMNLLRPTNGSSGNIKAPSREGDFQFGIDVGHKRFPSTYGRKKGRDR